MQYSEYSVRNCARRALCFISGIVFVIICSTAVVKSQTGTAPGASDTRARRAPDANEIPTTSEADAKPTAMEDVVSGPQNDKADKMGKPGAAKSSADEVKRDRVSVLRAQIIEARTEIERVRLQRTLVDYLIALGRNSEAAVELRAMLSAESLDAATYYNIGNGLAKLGESEQAVTAYRKAIDTRQGNYPRALNNLGVVLLDLGRMDEAFDAFVLAIKQQNFRYAEASYNLGRLYAARDEADLAISEWTRALTVQPDHIDAAIALARAYMVTGKPELGLEVIERTLKRTGANDRLEAVRDEITPSSAGK